MADNCYRLAHGLRPEHDLQPKAPHVRLVGLSARYGFHAALLAGWEPLDRQSKLRLIRATEPDDAASGSDGQG